MTELYVAEKYWPTGEPADTQRTLMQGSMYAASWGSAEAERNAQKIWLKLTGMAEPATINKKGMSDKEIKQKLNGLMA